MAPPEPTKLNVGKKRSFSRSKYHLLGAWDSAIVNVSSGAEISGTEFTLGVAKYGSLEVAGGSSDSMDHSVLVDFDNFFLVLIEQRFT
jgi:hypothetical protein